MVETHRHDSQFFIHIRIHCNPHDNTHDSSNINKTRSSSRRRPPRDYTLLKIEYDGKRVPGGGGGVLRKLNW